VTRAISPVRPHVVPERPPADLEAAELAAASFLTGLGALRGEFLALTRSSGQRLTGDK
jgi:hypothetical protein